ncbi:MAG: hypothetical protein J6C46_01720 [Clostridia bacterium]|nr:hypothetical protein [Clostridia bacterium]
MKIMKNFIVGMVIGSVVGGVIGTIASDEIYQIKKKAMKTGKKVLKKYDLI